MANPEYDFEKAPESIEVRAAVPERERGILGTLRYYEALLDAKLGVESHGARRITAAERKPPNLWVLFFIWSSAGTYSIAGLSTGFIPWSYGLSLGTALPILTLGNLLGAMLAAACATLGPGTGLRQVSITRYSMGWWPSKIIAAINVFCMLGWASIGCIAGGQALASVSNNQVSVSVGIIIIGILSILVSFGGYKILLSIEVYQWIPFFLLFLVIYGEVGPHATLHAPLNTPASMTTAILNYFAVMYGVGTGFAGLMADYCVHLPETVSKRKLWILITAGLTIPSVIGTTVGALIGSRMAVDDTWASAYNSGGFGALMMFIMWPTGFVRFMLVVLSLGGVGQNAIAIYSAALSIQQFAKPLQAIPRFIWSLVAFLVSIILGLAGKNQLLVFLNNILSLMGYNNTIFATIVFVEHFYFRKGKFSNYDLEGWNTPAKMPLGLAGLAAFLLGWTGAVLGMVQTFYIGVIAERIHGGGDVAIYISFTLTFLSFIPLRMLELKFVGR